MDIKLGLLTLSISDEVVCRMTDALQRFVNNLEQATDGVVVTFGEPEVLPVEEPTPTP
jgi:hypothetical protein